MLLTPPVPMSLAMGQHDVAVPWEVLGGTAGFSDTEYLSQTKGTVRRPVSTQRAQSLSRQTWGLVSFFLGA